MKKKNLNQKEKGISFIFSLFAYIIWFAILSFWFFIFNFFFGKKIGFAAGIPAIIVAYITVNSLKKIMNRTKIE